MIITQEDKITIHELSLLSGIDENEIQKIFESFLIQFIIKYTKSKRVHIPFIGNFLVRHKEDIETSKGREAQLDAFYAPHDEMKRIIGQLTDAEKTKNYTSIDVSTLLKKIVKNDFKTIIEE